MEILRRFNYGGVFTSVRKFLSTIEGVTMEILRRFNYGGV